MKPQLFEFFLIDTHLYLNFLLTVARPPLRNKTMPDLFAMTACADMSWVNDTWIGVIAPREISLKELDWCLE